MTDEAAYALAAQLGNLAEVTHLCVDANNKALDGSIQANHRLSLVEANISLMLAQRSGEIERAEREAIILWLRRMAVEAGLETGGRYFHVAAKGIEEGEHHATLQEAHGPSSNPPDSEASADSCERKGGTASPDTSG